MEETKNINSPKKTSFTNLKEANDYISFLHKELIKKEDSTVALNESEERFKLLAEIAPVGIFRTDVFGSTNFVNSTWCRISGMKYEKALSDGWIEAVHPDDRHTIIAYWKKRLSKKLISEAEYRFLKPDGSISWVIGQAIPVMDAKNKITGYMGTITDITSIKTTQEALNKRLEAEMLISSIASSFINLEALNTKHVLKKALEKTGIHAEVDRSYILMISNNEKYIEEIYEWRKKGIKKSLTGIKGQSISMFPWGVDKAKKLDLIRINSLSDLPKSAKNERAFLKALGVKSTLLFPMKIGDKLIGVYGFDFITKEKHWFDEEILLLGLSSEILVNAFKRVIAEQKLRDSEEKSIAITSAIPDLYFRISKDYIFLDCSNHHSSNFYVPIDSFMGKPIADVLPQDVCEKAVKNINISLKNQSLQVFHYSIVVKGEELWYEARMVPSGTNEVLVIVRNITEAIKQQKILEQKNEELEKYTSTVSHDLKSPLITIKGFASFLMEDINNKKYNNVRTDLNRIINATNKMSQMLDELLEVSIAGQIVQKTRNVQFGKIVKDVLALLSIIIKEKNASIVVSQKLPILRVDENRLKEVLQNLIENALKFTDPNIKPIIKIGYHIRHNKTTIFVEDNGIGIKPENKEKIFGMFTKLDTKSTGSGIGLALCKRIIEAHNGSIWVESDGIGKGAKFCFFIPKAIN